MFKFFYIISFLFLFQLNYSQDNYFQQEVNYKIDVLLNDVKHELFANERIQYINKSKDTLHFLYFHLWPNAYKNNKTALAKQLLEFKDTKMYYAKANDLGYIDSLDFYVDNKSIKWEFDKVHIDICKLFLNTPLIAGDTITITTPFHVKLPSAQFSRLGHIGQAYAITQWYPKPAVYDNTGWHPMPYLNQGEFYSEFGSYDVKITLPKNYVLAATGDRIDETDEELWLLSKADSTQKMINLKNYSSDLSFPPSSTEFKTIEFKQYRVHDFAWFADKRFHVLKGEIQLPDSKHKVTTWAFFTNHEAELWSKSIKYINDAAFFYSKQIGNYPYNHITAIDGTISAGGGMEYPNITIVGESGNLFNLETTIVHEVGHNWFYGILGSNERDAPFMDEGINSFYEMRYFKEKYPNLTLTSLIGKDSSFHFFGLHKLKHKAQYELSYLLAAKKNTDQPIHLKAIDFTNYNYGAIVYSKSALAFNYLMNFSNQNNFDNAMRFYYEQWKFKHPNYDDLFKTLDYYLTSDLTWFTDDIIKSNKKLDYEILKHKQLENNSHAILIKNNTHLSGPLSLSGFKNGQLIGTVWYNGFKGKRVFEFPASDIDEFKIDFNESTIDINRKNNTIKTSGLFKKLEPFQFNFIGKIDDPRYNQINYFPILNYNHYNKLTLGCAFYNYSFLQKKTEFTFAPMYAFGSKTPVGFFELNRYFTPHSHLFQQITFNTKSKSFAYNYLNPNSFNEINHTAFKPFNLNYYKMVFNLDFEIKKQNPKSNIIQHVGYTNTNLFTDSVEYKINLSNSSLSSINITNKKSIINTVYYTFKNSRAINPFDFTLNIQHNQLFGKANFSLNYAITLKNNKTFDFRLFTGVFIYGNTSDKTPYLFRMSGFSGYHDYLFDYNYIGRNETQGVAAAQFIENDGAFKIPTTVGQSSKGLIALNVKSPKISKLPVKLYSDFGISETNTSKYTNSILYNTGIDICLWKNIIDIYIPIIYSKEIKTDLTTNHKGFFDTIRFTLNLHHINPRNFITNNFL